MNTKAEKAENEETQQTQQKDIKSEKQTENPSGFSMRAKQQTALRALREHLVDACVSLARVGFFWVSGGDEAIGRALMSFHLFVVFGVALLFFALPTRHPLRVVILVAAMLMLAHQILLRGCVLTRAEQRLTGRKETCIDPFLNLSGLAVTNDTRYLVTIVGTAVGTVLMTWVVFCDFVGGRV